MSRIASPDCRDQNHQKCPGDAWDEAHDHITECQCSCHAEPDADPRFEAVARGLNRYLPNSFGMIQWAFDMARTALAAADAVDPLRQPGHRVDVDGFQWALQHPAECRPDLFACPLTRALAKLGVSGLPDGEHTVELTEDGSLFFPDEVTP